LAFASAAAAVFTAVNGVIGATSTVATNAAQVAQLPGYIPIETL
jgi:hypothetical protein